MFCAVLSCMKLFHWAGYSFRRLCARLKVCIYRTKFGSEQFSRLKSLQRRGKYV
jgi:hypothetical protein